MKRGDFYQKVSAGLGKQKLEISARAVKNVFEVAYNVIVKDIVKEKKIPIGKLGFVKVVDRKARKGRNPKTGETIQIPAKKALRMRPSNLMKRAIS